MKAGESLALSHPRHGRESLARRQSFFSLRSSGRRGARRRVGCRESCCKGCDGEDGKVSGDARPQDGNGAADDRQHRYMRIIAVNLLRNGRTVCPCAMLAATAAILWQAGCRDGDGVSRSGAAQCGSV